MILEQALKSIKWNSVERLDGVNIYTFVRNVTGNIAMGVVVEQTSSSDFAITTYLMRNDRIIWESEIAEIEGESSVCKWLESHAFRSCGDFFGIDLDWES